MLRENNLCNLTCRGVSIIFYPLSCSTLQNCHDFSRMDTHHRYATKCISKTNAILSGPLPHYEFGNSAIHYIFACTSRCVLKPLISAKALLFVQARRAPASYRLDEHACCNWYEWCNTKTHYLPSLLSHRSYRVFHVFEFTRHADSRRVQNSNVPNYPNWNEPYQTVKWDWKKNHKA